MGIYGHRDQFPWPWTQLVLDEHRNREKKISLLALVYYKALFSCFLFLFFLFCFQFKNYIMNSEAFETQCGMVAMFKPWRQKPGLEYFPNFLKPWVKHLTFHFSYQ